MKRLLLITVFVAALGGHYAQACSCAAPPPPKEALAKSDAVFAGEVLEVKLVPAPWDASWKVKQVTFEVSQVWKGDIETRQIVTTSRDGAMCGYSFSVGGLTWCMPTRGNRVFRPTSAPGRRRSPARMRI